ncbi:hypothetical protein KS4_34980 [Poriferisphaera corsica]|uniref:Uncharacterized protein n=1 Tax=Poriferisphaera corsica TaxID=2528020 RepID=A0A517YYY3_9BACT|nr:hypothetical protein [Poriferisphaera corsica]QDU35417.1 hypothetical protein KS4_34980 [Poriferisphaera corsica]
MPKQSSTNGQLLEKMETFLFSLPHVFATIQWGGKAYKLPDTKGNKSKPKLFIFSTLGSDDDGSYLHAEFKLPLQQANDAVEKYDWLNFSTFGNWAKNGWCSAKIRKTAHLKPLLALFKITYENLPKPAETSEPKTAKRPSNSKNKQQQTTSSPIARKIDRVMDQITLPPDDEAFDRL